MSKEINESNFKVLCLKDDYKSPCNGKYYFNKYDVLEFKNGFTVWKGNTNEISCFKYKSFVDLLNSDPIWKDGGYFELIEVDGQPVNHIENKIINLNLSKKCEEVKQLLKENNIQQQNTNSKQFDKLWDSEIINNDLITLNWGDEKQFFEAYKNNEGIVYIDENVMELNYEQCVELYKWLQRVVSFVDNNKEIDMTKEQIEKELGHKINIVD